VAGRTLLGCKSKEGLHKSHRAPKFAPGGLRQFWGSLSARTPFPGWRGGGCPRPSDPNGRGHTLQGLSRWQGDLGDLGTLRRGDGGVGAAPPMREERVCYRLLKAPGVGPYHPWSGVPPGEGGGGDQDRGRKKSKALSNRSCLILKRSRVRSRGTQQGSPLRGEGLPSELSLGSERQAAPSKSKHTQTVPSSPPGAGRHGGPVGTQISPPTFF